MSTINDVLPNELLVEIFTHYILPAAVRIGTNARIQRGPLLLCRVCHRWRAVCLAAPQFWTTLVAAPGGEDGREDRFIELLESWLTRAGELPIELVLKLPRPTSSLSRRILSTALRCPGQLRRLQLPLYPLFSLNRPLPFSRLEDLTIHGNGIVPDDSDALVCFSEASSLRRVSLTKVPLLDITLPWHQLTELALAKVHIFTLFTVVLEYTPLLRRLEVGETYGPLSFYLRSERATLKHLFILRLGETPEIGALIMQSILPALYSLELFGVYLNNATISELCVCASHSQWSHLRVLRLHRVAIRDRDLFKLLRYEGLHGLEYLEISDAVDQEMYYVYSLLRELVEEGYDTPIVPALRGLTIDRFPVEIDVGMIQRVLEARARPGPNARWVRLEAFRLFYAQSRTTARKAKIDVGKQLFALRPFIDEGVKVQIELGYRSGSRFHEGLDMLGLPAE
ncbi:F-box domain-containing protein [Mycena kentingensis (nom. inval.)]|nr:F-box domain-containing protein [Mycena kentingensis (nom. inval.)]